MTAIAPPYAPTAQTEIFDAYMPSSVTEPEALSQAAPGALDRLRTIIDANLELDVPDTDIGRFITHKVGLMALGMGVLDTVQTTVMMDVRSIREQTASIPYEHLTKDALIILGGVAIYKFGVGAVDRWWNKK